MSELPGELRGYIPIHEGDGDRPWCCPEPRCTVVHQLRNEDSLSRPAPGDSFICFGRMPKGIEFVYDGDRHRNDLRSCHYTPLKGLIANQENRDDWVLVGEAYRDALNRLDYSGEETRDA